MKADEHYLPHNPDATHGRLAAMIMTLLALWDVQQCDIPLLLGLQADQSQYLEMLQKGTVDSLPPELYQRFSELLCCHSLLKTLFPGRADLAYSWMSQPNHAFGGESPMAIVIRDKTDGLNLVRNYLEDQC
ncbi:MbcA/ParS/Xre antitoxin family protein [Burkholderiaceae bacterium DAT-1]|nr:MbcA/ParS/Xre antitoxin family protein [Burkholderiaceae bacterium DAT-1]